MRNYLLLLMLLPQFMVAQLLPNLGGQRVGISTAQFLKIGIGPRAVGMGEAYVAVADDIESLYYNPAGIALFERQAVFFSHTQWVVDVQLEYTGAVYHLDGSNTVGVAITYLHTDDMKETTELQPFGTGRMFSFADFMIGFTYARNMTDQFSFGVTTKFMQETIADLTMNAVLFDLGTYYKTGWHSTRFAVSVSNFGSDMSPTGMSIMTNLTNQQTEVSSYQSFAPPTIFRIGLASELLERPNHRVTGAIQLNHPNDNAENINFGVEYWWNETLALRGGFKTAQAEETFSLGVGLHFPITMADFRLDFAHTQFGRLGNVNRFAVQLMF
jgi:hypothetical protein